MWANYHTHSTYCDGKSSLADCVSKAVALNVGSLGISSHAPLPFSSPWCMPATRLPGYLADLAILKKQHTDIELYAGLEIDFIPRIISPRQFQDQLDYTIGSVHFVDSLPDGRPWEIDGQHTLFLEGLEKIFHNNIRDAITRYLELTREMIISSPPDIVGHLDKIKIQNKDNKLFDETDAWYREEMVKTLDAISEAGCILEVNTRGIYQRKTTTTYPSPWVLELALERNISITINSDAHHPDDITNQFEETAGMLRRIGFKKIAILRNGNWQPVDFTSNGIHIH